MRKFKIVKDFSGDFLKLVLVKIEEYKDKNYDLYDVCKVVKKNGSQTETENIPLYRETFTPDQVESFYKNPTYYLVDEP